MRKNNFAVVLLLFFALGELYALPRFALQQQDRCIDCHVNPTGGIMRNENGWFFGKNVVGMVSPRDKELAMSPKIGDNISYGFDFRTQYLYSGEKKRSDFQEMSGSIYTNVDLSKKINVVARYDFITSFWEAYAVARILPGDSYIKAGSFTPAFGIRGDDHTAYTRGGDFGILSATGANGMLYTPYYAESGIELGMNLTDYANITLSAGKIRMNSILAHDPSFTARAEFTPHVGSVGLMFGGSYAKAGIFRPDTPGGFDYVNAGTSFYGGFFGAGWDKLSLLAEYNVGDNYVGKDIASSYMMVEGSYRIMIGLEAIVRYDRLDRDSDISGNELSRLNLGFEFFPYSFVEVRPQYRINMEDPSVDNDAFVLQFHFWY
ncbi:MAG: hypothetical protein K9I71_04285 [Ignavibacteriales bacterium]|nr:hypothetical protein [Ignavibacteriales bacterium]MCF8315316.1 hypothetical protein [Ignavibacteriales bacterium]MCF8436792.1 hypothetical protein [Ignavibacteriales bacterium]